MNIENTLNRKNILYLIMNDNKDTYYIKKTNNDTEVFMTEGIHHTVITSTVFKMDEEIIKK
jgi:hypothetical protein